MCHDGESMKVIEFVLCVQVSDKTAVELEEDSKLCYICDALVQTIEQDWGQAGWLVEKADCTAEIVEAPDHAQTNRG